MGWLFSREWQTRKELETHLLSECKYEKRYIDHAWSGTNIWIAMETIEHVPIIMLCLTAKHKKLDGYGYKDMSESSHPYYYDCPKRILNKVPVACKEWREKVEKFHQNKVRVKNMKKALAVGIVLTLKNCKIPEVRIRQVKPKLLGTYDDVTYRITPKVLAEATIKDS